MRTYKMPEWAGDAARTVTVTAWHEIAPHVWERFDTDDYDGMNAWLELSDYVERWGFDAVTDGGELVGCCDDGLRLEYTASTW